MIDVSVVLRREREVSIQILLLLSKGYPFEHISLNIGFLLFHQDEAYMQHWPFCGVK